MYNYILYIILYAKSNGVLLANIQKFTSNNVFSLHRTSHFNDQLYNLFTYGISICF